jgi:hypothetical protein
MQGLPPAVAGVLFRAVATIKNNFTHAQGCLPRPAVDAFIERVMDEAQAIFLGADRKVCGAR